PRSMATARCPAACAAAALFAAHPLASETVAYISSRSESLAGMWYLVAVIAFIRARTTPAGTSVIWGVVIAFAGMAGAASKETVFTLFGVLPLYDWLLIA